MRHGIDHPVINDSDFEIWQSYTIRAWPTIVLINPDGKIVDTQSGEFLAEIYPEKIKILIQDFIGNGLDQAPFEIKPNRLTEPTRILNYPSKLLIGPQNTLFVADTGHHRILKIELDKTRLQGEVTQVFGTGHPGFVDGTEDVAQFHDPHGMALLDSRLYVADTENHAIRVIDLANGQTRTVAGTGQKAQGQFTMGGPTEVSLRSPWALWAEDNILLIAMAGSHQIWALVDETRLGIFAGTGSEALVDGPLQEASFNQPSDLSAGFNHLFVMDSEASAVRAISMDEAPKVMTLIGQGLFEFGDVDGIGAIVRLQHPTGLSFHEGLIYIADSYNHKIKALDPTTAEVKTIIGTGEAGNLDGPFFEATLFEPEGITAIDNYLFIADTNNHLIRVADLSTQTVDTLNLKNLHNLSPFSNLHSTAPIKLNPIFAKLGEISISVVLNLPRNFIFNLEAPHQINISVNDQTITANIIKNDLVCFEVALYEETDIEIELTLYYCEKVDKRLCMIYRKVLILPIKVGETEADKIDIVHQIDV